MDTNTNSPNMLNGLQIVLSQVSTNSSGNQIPFVILSNEIQEEINKCIQFRKEQTLREKIQEALLNQLKFFYAARVIVLFLYPICTLVIFSIMLYMLYGESIMNHKVFSGLTFMVGLAAIFEIIFFPAKEKSLESQIKSISLDFTTQEKKITLLEGKVISFEKLNSKQTKEIESLNKSVSQLQQTLKNSSRRKK